jgi:outer membrane protein OmpA-like peptidoglycan-associated protein
MMLSILLVFAGNSLAEDELRTTFFREADAALARANVANAKLLAPKSYEKGTRAYAAAEDGLNRGRNIQFLRDKTAEAATSFDLAAQTAGLAKTVLARTLESRQDALRAQSSKLANEAWERANREFAAAIRFLERGDLKNAKNTDIDAAGLYQDAELAAIKAQYLTRTRQLLADADRQNVGRYATITLRKAKQVLADAERELEENRYDADYPRSLARQANYEAKHALYLAEIALDIRDKNLTVEALVLQWEQHLTDIADAADLVPSMATGPEALKRDLVDFVEKSSIDVQNLEQDVASAELRLSAMEEEIQALDERLGGATEEQLAMAKRLEVQAQVSDQLKQVEVIFTKQEARVFREGEDIIIRLLGLNFESGQSEITKNSLGLLAKVETAIGIFPQSELVIEGHTDSHGGDVTNQMLSQERAEALQRFMIYQMNIPQDRISAIGYGETNPVANNETASGRAKNRRIDVVIRPTPYPA